MRSLMGFIRTTVRILVGSILLCVGIVTALRLARLDFEAGGVRELQGELFADILCIVLGVVGLGMLTSLLGRKKEARPEN